MPGIGGGYGASGCNCRGSSGGVIDACELLDESILLAGNNLLAAGMVGRHVFAAALISHVTAASSLLFVEGSVGSKAGHHRRCTEGREHCQT